VGASLGADDSETITGARHVQVGKQSVKVFRSHATECWRTVDRDSLKVVTTELLYKIDQTELSVARKNGGTMRLPNERDESRAAG
jgi:hypothetical protein